MSSYQSYTDAQLLALLNRKDQSAFTEIYGRYWEQLVDTGYYYTRDKQSVEEIVNDVFMRLWEKAEVFQVRSLKDYLGTAVKFGVFKALLKAKRRKALLKDYTVATWSAEEEQRIESRFTEAYLNGIIEALPEKSRLIFKYSRVEGMRVAEIAEKMDMQPKAVEYHITKALKVLRDAVDNMNGPEALSLLLLVSALCEMQA